ncbi:MAG: dihydrodipicolinate synthase family protein [Planctomycetaceae bacterium]|nr:dihydrodipicolinate synthase family protein [Planctomycetaceae bacterium]
MTESSRPAVTECIQRIQPGRRITGMSAVLLPFLPDGSVDWPGFDEHVSRTLDAGLIPAVNMDTGYINLLDEATKATVLTRTQALVAGGRFVAGAFVRDQPGAAFDFDEYAARFQQIQQAGGTPVVFQSFGLTQQTDEQVISAYQRLAGEADQFIWFELSRVFAPFGSVYSLNVYEGMMQIPQCIGAKHSSLQREAEWDRLALRDRCRPEFLVLTGNDLAIDMVMYGSDYLLGLSSFAPDLFGMRDRMWVEQDPAFYQLNDILQYLGFFAFRGPVPAYKHTAAMFLHLRGWLQSSLTHPDSPTRPESDREVLERILEMLSDYL